jgi:hypothetical protein
MGYIFLDENHPTASVNKPCQDTEFVAEAALSKGTRVGAKLWLFTNLSNPSSFQNGQKGYLIILSNSSRLPLKGSVIVENFNLYDTFEIGDTSRGPQQVLLANSNTGRFKD